MSVAKGFRLSDNSTASLDWNYVTKSDGTKSIIEEVNDVKADLSDLQEEIEGGGSGMSTAFKQALHNIFEQVAFIGDDGQDYLNALDSAMFPPVTAISLNHNSLSFATLNSTQQLIATTTPTGGNVTWSSSDTSVATVSSTGLVTSIGYGNATITATSGSVSASCSVTIAQATLTSISAVYTQSGTVYDTDTLDSLKSDLVVTAHWSNSTTSTVADTDYTLSGTLTEGTSTITVSYGGKTTTFNVTVTHAATDTTAEIATDGYVWEHKNSPDRMEQTAIVNGGITTKYELSQPSATLALAGIIPTDGVIVSGRGALMVYDENDENFNYIGECTASDTRFGQDVDGTTCEYSWRWTLASSVYSIECSVDTRYLDDAYLYDVNTGQVLFAGSNTPYYGMSNISERVLPVTDTTADVDIEGYASNWTNNTRSTVAKTYAGITKKYSIPATTILNPVGIIPIAKNDTIANDIGIITVFDSNDNIITHVSEKIASDARWCKEVGFGDTIIEYSKSWTVGKYTKIEFCVDMRYLADAYMYDGTTGQVFFAGKNTPYYGMSNISEANS